MCDYGELDIPPNACSEPAPSFKSRLIPREKGIHPLQRWVFIGTSHPGALSVNRSSNCNCRTTTIAGFSRVMENDSKTLRNGKLKEIHSQTTISIAAGFMFLGLGALSVIPGIRALHAKGSVTLENLSLLGSYLQGSSAGLWSLAGLTFIYAAFLSQREQLLRQEIEIEDQKKQFEIQQETTRHHNRLSVKPHLVKSHQVDWNNDGAVFTVDLCNHGIGPARIKNATLFLDGNRFSSPKGNPVEELIHARIAGKIAGYTVRKCSWPSNNYSLVAGQVYRMLELFIPGAKKSDESVINDLFNGTDIRIEYESFYEEPDVLDSRKK